MPPTILDSRRLTGLSLLLDGPGAILDVRLEEEDVDRAIGSWRSAALRLLQAVGWSDQSLIARRFPGGVSLALTAPLDGLYAATDLNERAWEAAAAELAGQPGADCMSDIDSLRSAVAAERNPALLSLRDQAADRGLTFLIGEKLVSVGSGTGALVWREDALPTPSDVNWSLAHDVPITLVTGSNGKTTVVRLLGEMVRTSGRTPGLTSTEGVIAGSAVIGEGDFSGPSGARLALRRSEVQIAVLETARGGILRRGLPVERANVAVITNVAEDHLGEFGIETLAQLADTKLVVTKALGAEGTLVLNADDPTLVERRGGIKAPIAWFSLDAGSELIRAHTEGGGTAVLADQGSVVLVRNGSRLEVAAVADMPFTFGGTAEHNIANALAAVAAGIALGLEVGPIAATLRRFGRNAADNPGRTNLIELGGARILLDFAHNPDGMLTLVRLAKRIGAKRFLLMVGQAGDRSDEAIRELARAAWSLRPSHVVVKDMEEYRRGRGPGEVPALLADEFLHLGVEDGAISRAGSDLEGVRLVLDRAREGDLLVLAVHQDRRALMGLLERLQTDGWRAGEPLPA